MIPKIRVLHVLGKLNRGGAETMVMNIYRNIDRSKIQFDFIVHTDEHCDYTNEIKSLGGKIYRVPRYKGINHLHYKKAWHSFFEDHPEYKIIHGHVRSTASIYLNIAKKYGLKTIAHSHSTSSGNGFSAIIKNILQYRIRYTADYLFACSRDAGIWLFGEKACNKENFIIVKNAIDLKKFLFNRTERIRIRKDFNINNKFVIGHVGRFDKSKNHIFLLDIFRNVYSINSNTMLMMVGDGPQRKIIEKKVENLGLNHCVIFTGNRSDIHNLLQAMDVFVFPSLYEGLGMAVIEAQASGLYCIVSDKIPKEALLTNQVEVISLDSPPEIWANRILKNALNYKRDDTFNILRDSGYDVIETSNWISNFYQNIL